MKKEFVIVISQVSLDPDGFQVQNELYNDLGAFEIERTNTGEGVITFPAPTMATNKAFISMKQGSFEGGEMRGAIGSPTKFVFRTYSEKGQQSDWVLMNTRVHLEVWD